MLRRHSTKKLDAMLLESKIINEEQLNNALKRQSVNGESLSKNIIELGYIDEDTLAEYIASESGMPYISLSCYDVSKDLLNVIPENISRIYGLIPLDLIGDILTVGIVDALDDDTIRRMEHLTGFNIKLVLVTSGEFNECISRIYDIAVVDSDIDETESDARLDFVKTPTYEGKERRRFPRFDKEIKVKYEFKDEYNITTSINISQGGLLIKSKSPVPVDSHIIARAELPTSHEDVIIISRIVRVEEIKDSGSYLIALQFCSMDARDNKRLMDYTRSILPACL